VQTRHDQGSECIIHLRFRHAEPCAMTAPQACAGCVRTDPGFLQESLSAAAVRRYRSESSRAFAMHKTIFVSEFLRRQFLRAVPGADMSRCRVIHNFIDSDQNAQALTFASGSVSTLVQPGQVLLVGRIDAGKGFRQFLAEACPRLPAWATLTIIGDGPERAALAREFAHEQVRFAGWQSNRLVMHTASRSHVWVVPSVWEEPFGMTTLEALWLGKPCIALRRGGTPELAAYQRYEGQLQLAQNMPELVDLLLSALTVAPAELDLAAPFAADCALLIPKILECYAD
jgi:glycogen synthase